jgi:hypothetical protein
MNPLQIVLSNEIIDAIDLTKLNKYVEWNSDNFKYFNLEAGKEHYKLLAYLSTVITSKKIIDIGTYFGFSATAFAYNKDKQIISYDIFDWIPDDKITIKSAENVQLKVMNCLYDIDNIIDTDLIMIDIDHNGNNELNILDTLRKANYKGLVLLDDIGLNEEMIKLWNDIPEKKIDISSVGHWSKTGLVIFDPSRFDIILN